MKTDDIRAAFLDYFAARQHRVVASSSLVPGNDPTLLFTNAGMVQFKDALTGREQPSYRRAVSCQRCVRAGGKHNDLENVGYTGRHLTLFEMLGNFSFGDYFKEDAIDWAWTFVTEELKLDRQRIWVTVHPTDDEARAIWERKIGIPPERVISHEENFWAMGDTGPCGPDSELFYDLGPDVAGGPPGSPDEDGDRFSEFWNLVFPQFDRASDGTLTPLDAPGVDTGMGLERIAAIVQGALSSYENDLMSGLVATVGGLAGIRDEQDLGTTPSLRVIADHARSAAFLIGDGVMPSNEDRGYVLRRIIRRALRHGHKLDIRTPFFHRLVAPVADAMGDAYPILSRNAERIADVLAAEEDRFNETLRSGMALLERALAELDKPVIPGDLAFKLYDTHGFPVDLTADIARERGLTLDQAGFDAAMQAQRDRGRAAAGRFAANVEQSIRIAGEVAFSGYAGVEGEATVVGLFAADGEATPVDTLAAGEEGIVVLDTTPFYAEAGGQVGDRGVIAAADSSFRVADTTKGGAQHLHHGSMQRGALSMGDRVRATVEAPRRAEIALNHSATHLLHAALRQILGAHVEQRGSLVEASRLRFDFSHPQPVSAEELRRIETTVNARIRENSPVVTEEMSFDAAIDKGAMALFDEKYADRVRVLTMADGFSVELCGGTHVRRTGDIGLLRIVGEEGIAAGVRRVEAVTGARALAWIDAREQQLDAVAELVRAPRADVAERVQRLVDESKSMQKELAALRDRLAAAQGADMAEQAVLVNGIRVLATSVDGDAKAMTATMDKLRDQLGDAVVVLGHAGPRVSLVAGVSKGVTDRLSAAELIKHVGAQVGARGGGRAHMAKAGGGSHVERLPAALASVADWVREHTEAASSEADAERKRGGGSASGR